MISKAIIREFLAAERNNFDWIKAESHKRLDASLAEMRPRPDFGKIQPWANQKAGFLILAELKRFMLHTDMGGGKTLVTLLLVQYLKQIKYQPRAIVFVPYITAVGTWIDEIELHTPGLKCVPLLGTTKQNLEALKTAQGDVFVICYQSAVAMVSESMPTQKRGKSKWNFKAADIRAYFDGFNVLVMDEIHKAKSATSLTYRMCRAISKQAEYALGLTGTPFGRDPIDLWTQFNLIDFGDTLGPTKGFFECVFFEQDKKGWTGFELKFNSKLKPELNRIIKNISISYAIEDLHDMPPRRYVIKRIKPCEGQEVYAKEAIKKVNEAAALKDKTTYGIVQSQYLRLRQLSSGFLTLYGDEREKLEIKFDENPKLEALEELIASMPCGRKMVVFNHFIFTGKMLSDHLKKLKIGHARVWSGQRDQLGELKRFKNDPDCEILLLNDQLGSSSLNLQFANYCVFFEQPDSAINRQQAERRVWRPGQTRRTFFYDLFVKGTYDEPIYRANAAGKNLLKEIIK